MGSKFPKCLQTFDFKSILLKLIVGFALLSVFYLYLISSSFYVSIFTLGFSDQLTKNVTYTPPKLTSVVLGTGFSNISTTNGFKITPLVLASFITSTSKTLINTTTQVNPDTTTASPTTRGAQVKTGPLYMTAAFMGRLGNQLFIYASLLGIARAQNRTAFIRRGTDLEKAFQITRVNSNINTAGFRTVRQSRYAAFEPKLTNLSRENITLVGYLQVWRYFKNIEEDIRREFTFSASLQKQINDILDKVRSGLKGHVTVGVHVRRGDFLSKKNQRLGYGVAKVSYFVKAFDRMRSLLNTKNVTFVISSDDLGWCRSNFKSTDIYILEPASPLLHFGVLANCDHVILAGGTYGWWSAWLANGITIYYDRFLVNGTALIGGVNLQDYYPPEWISLGD